MVKDFNQKIPISTFIILSHTAAFVRYLLHVQIKPTICVLPCNFSLANAFFLIWCIWSYKDDFQQYINFDYCIGKIWCHTYNVCHVDMSQFFCCCCQRSQSRESNFKFSIILPTSASAWHLPYIKIRPCCTVPARLLQNYENFDLIWL